jgi:hypothetical protein
MGVLTATMVTMVLLVTGRLDAGYAAAMTMYTVGSPAGGVVNRRLVDRVGRIRAVVPAGAARIGVLVVTGSVRSLSAGVSLAVLGLTGMVWNASAATLMQQRGPPTPTCSAASARPSRPWPSRAPRWVPCWAGSWARSGG